MPYASLQDDGQQVTLDLHGLRVAEARDLARRVVRESVRRGRRTVRLIHGSSGRREAPAATIRQALHDLLDEGVLGGGVVSAWRGEDVLTLVLDATAPSLPGRMALLDFLR